ncbi:MULTISPECIES: NAD+ synthase [unclassified Hydrogenobaculum]|uniref:NAD+ synthase n=1 Tax=unclassified Hydrogenobaculum TaxID=2622382 RepID=UPI0001C51828|nr:MULTISPECIES: NAD+ synthase [unclassified Hydrogenobaculum]AEF19765.1 NAD+ synthetase [Hydrogenobaculum sp. 3684]AEG47052.1 NAD+ synthetase [Hydrogenobaculum sp. SHO]AGG15700.1 NH(3)-dependent NAD(+) synthetase [Hydrogenobaculum sp. HO]AGH93999.1 NH(3)-dependent NAD(+) synthetase [Hydrogenobaculum sp. SN]
MSSKILNVSLCQINTTVGAFEKNFEKICDFISKAKNSHIIVFPELSLCGYMPQDIIYSSKFLDLNKRYFEKLKEYSKNIDSVIVVGFVREEKAIYNSLGVLFKGEVLGFYDKRFLPNYNVFDEKRYFKSGEKDLTIDINDIRCGFSICEDIWYPDGTERQDALKGAEVLININASPYALKKQDFKENFLKARASDNLCFLVYTNLVGANDELVFNGESLVIGPKGDTIAKAKAFEEDILHVSLDIKEVFTKRRTDLRWQEVCRPINSNISINISKNQRYDNTIHLSLSKEEELIKAITLSIKDFFEKQGFSKAILGLSGGIDSALVLYLAVLALGKENVKAVYMPTVFNKEESYKDAKALCENLGVELSVFPIEDIRNIYNKTLSYGNFDIADENLQARIRANILFYISNKENRIVLSTSNKSESAVGYTTIYGDMAGGFSPIKDLYKTEVYEIAYFINKDKEIIPKNIIERPPSAELKPNQKDQDTLPPYDVLDKILWLLIEECKDKEDITEFDKEIVEKVYDMLLKAEYKRKQAPIGPKLHERAFGIGWRYPIVRDKNI